MEPSIEVLVHISAPGDAEDDANHRALANAFLHFEPATKFRIYPDDSDGSDQLHILTQASNSDQENRGRCGSTDRSTPPWKRGIDAGYERDDSVFYDDFEERPSCDFYEGAEGDTEIIPSPTKFNETDSFETPPATVPDSQPPFSPTWDVLKYAQRDGDSGMESPAGEISILEPIAATEEKPSEVPVSQGNVVELGSFEVPSESAFGSQFSFRSIGDPERSISPAMRSIKPVRIREPPSSSEKLFHLVNWKKYYSRTILVLPVCQNCRRRFVHHLRKHLTRRSLQHISHHPYICYPKKWAFPGLNQPIKHVDWAYSSGDTGTCEFRLCSITEGAHRAGLLKARRRVP
ncbi:uncharacterized protein CIMG_02376 [Coccidioides immitis RS]|uniref:Uncharacterized protein n=1 Tax=Coccidioides immitis (strain RS) TaxID=246410 RepID=J3KL89_COCIM|nr:uncharacterized protein CIMG_02376 [Coccidioides immitis RS]EAS37022.3 hypothetical protein CIMG_02376 [Coccidioides immitis RS]